MVPVDAARLAQDVSQLCDLATNSDPELARYGSDAIFRDVVEPLGDGFEPSLCDLYVQFFAQVIQYCRRLPQGSSLDELLCKFDLASADALIRRAQTIRDARTPALDPVRIIVVLSRVTLGADVAITSVILRKMMHRFPNVRLILIAGRKTALLFAGEPRIVVREVGYPRSGLLLDRLAVWPAVVNAITEETAHLHAQEYLVLDPDSRLTQLGMLPVVRDESQYLFFESRSFKSPGCGTLAELTAAWLEECFGPGFGPLHPWVALPPGLIERARAITAVGGQRWVAINLGVGDNPRKRVDGQFEERLLSELLRSGRRIFLDKGDGPDEMARIEGLLRALRVAGWRVADIDEQRGSPPAAAEVVAWRGSLAGFAALIAASDTYIGYDSACQHIAAALGVKTVDIFAGFRSPRMVERWKPSGPGKVVTVAVDPEAPPDSDRILAAALEAVQ